MHRAVMHRAVVALCLLLAGFIFGAAATYRTVARIFAPTVAEETTGDAVVVLAGSPADRVTRGLELMDEGAANVLVLSAGVDEPRGWNQIQDVCDADHEFEVVCVVPQSNNTIGEAATISRLAEAEGWDKLVLVTSAYHLDRATAYFTRCFSGEIRPAAAAPQRFTWPLVRHEIFAAVHARTVGLRCPSSPPPSIRQLTDEAAPVFASSLQPGRVLATACLAEVGQLYC